MPFELSKIKFEDLKRGEFNYSLYVRNTWIPLHVFFTEIIDNYLKNERSNTLSQRSSTNWLFFGQKYNYPISNITIHKIFENFGIKSLKSYKAALENAYINGNTIPSILVSGVGISIATAIKYYNIYNINNSYEIKSIQDTSELFSLTPKGLFTYNVYILKCNDGSYYTGFTSDLNKRVTQHQNGTGCTYTKTRTPVELVYKEELPDKSSALKREKQIKKLTIFEKEQLIEKSRAN